MSGLRVFAATTMIYAICGAQTVFADDYLNAKALKTLYSDVRVDTVTRRGNYPMTFHFRADGTYSQRFETRRGVRENEGKWWVEEPDKICRTTVRSDRFCMRHKKTDSGYDRYRAEEDRKFRSVWKFSKDATPVKQTSQNCTKPEITKFYLEPSTFSDGQRVQFHFDYRCVEGGLQNSKLELWVNGLGEWDPAPGLASHFNRRIQKRLDGRLAHTVKKESGHFYTGNKMNLSQFGMSSGDKVYYRLRIINNGKKSDEREASALYR